MLSIISNVISNFILYLSGKLINYYDLLETITHEVRSKKYFYQIFLKISFFIKLKIVILYLVLFLLGFFVYIIYLYFALFIKKFKKIFLLIIF